MGIVSLVNHCVETEIFFYSEKENLIVCCLENATEKEIFFCQGSPFWEMAFEIVFVVKNDHDWNDEVMVTEIDEVMVCVREIDVFFALVKVIGFHVENDEEEIEIDHDNPGSSTHSLVPFDTIER